ncbi:MAG: sulfotransferase domain-containing protein, partial [Gammaproteobacteria bacterium]|nr:sulfotransferase domain-containing protein [Gammaproteobacteria bacterium]
NTIERVANFIGIGLDDELRAMTLEYTSIEFMLKYKHQFSDAPMRRLSEERCNLPSDSDSAKVRNGKAGAHKQELTRETIIRIDEVWKEVITPQTGYPTYEALAAELAQTG